MPELPRSKTLLALKRPIGWQYHPLCRFAWARTLAIPSPAQFRKQVAGQKIVMFRVAQNTVIHLKD
ncbi:hypothetical protein [Candidatus Villigracilis affinis]|uniref:hypothetical protein n=1 Tax=Candidatus Villigracilis affinis TaxID=3140682 RepID=UPI002A1E013C|nr:hypothetical protein [Anaerolineales bacterium]